MCLPSNDLYLITNQSLQAVNTNLGAAFSSPGDWTVIRSPGRTALRATRGWAGVWVGCVWGCVWCKCSLTDLDTLSPEEGG